jgi:hypothetical protein
MYITVSHIVALLAAGIGVVVADAWLRRSR